jgi:hypothetical protein
MTDILKRLTDYIAQCPSANGRTFHEMDEEVLIAQSADEIAKLRAALRKIAAIEDEHINVPKTNEGANLWACLAMCVELAETALEEKKDD